MSKKFNVHDIVHKRQNELDSSPLFQRKTPAPTVKQESPLRSQPEDTPAPPQVTFQPPPTEIDDDAIDQTMTDGVHDVMTSARQDVNYRAWREVIENTETHNSALRLTRQERYDIEDLISELERTHHIKTSMNELARLGLLSILHDYKQRQRESLVYQVKNS